MKVTQWIKELQLNHLLLNGNFGLEKENIRTTLSGDIALTPHPRVFGDKATHPYITTDFAEAQVEMVTPIFPTTHAVLKFMEALHDLVSLELSDEVLWPYSLPPKLPSDDSLIKAAQFTNPEITEYREYLASKYGKRKQLLSGVHFNFSFCDKFLDALYSKVSQRYSYREFKDQIYLKIARYYLKYSWLIIYLTGTSSIAHQSYVDCCKRPMERLTEDSVVFSNSSSFRNGVSGYRNLEDFYVSYNSLFDYINDIELAIENGYIIAAKEYYSQIRLKGTSKQGILDDLYNNGISYVEIRSLDLNPMVKIGITADSLDLIHLFMVYSLVAEDFVMSKDEYYNSSQNQILASDANNQQDILLHNGTNQTRELHEWGHEVLANVYTTLSDLGIHADKLAVIDKFKAKLDKATTHNATIIANEVKKTGYADFFIGKAKDYLAMSQETYYKFAGFEDLELSTQILLKEAIKNGINFALLDREDNFIELSRNKVKHYVKQATKTCKDNYVSIMAMENKLVTKKILSENNIRTPLSDSYILIANALDNFMFYQDKAIVIKPNSTNFGIGVSIFKNNASYAEFKHACELAFSFDSKILIEDYVCGCEYRFFVINDEVVAVLLREPANVIGDGVSTIAQLVAIKNQNPLRGENYIKPLEKISLGAVETTYLTKQSLTINSIIQHGEKIYLRENSNISTGGDSIDYTDSMPAAYKRIAVKAVQSVNAQICGVDMLIKNYKTPYIENNYSIIELNFNPAIHIHTYPYQGKDRKIANRILHLLNLI